MSANIATPELLLAGLKEVKAELLQVLRAQGVRMTRQEVCDRLGIHRNTLASYIADKGFPKPTKDGKWLRSEVVAWDDER